MGAGSKSFLSVHTRAASASVSVTSDPVGASIFLDGKAHGSRYADAVVGREGGQPRDSGQKAGIPRRDQTPTCQAGQIFHYSATLRPLGSTDEIKTVKKFKKVFGGGDAAEMGTVTIKTNPEGAQIAVNRRILDKISPADFYLNPGTYVVDISLSGFQPVQKVVTVTRAAKWLSTRFSSGNNHSPRASHLPAA